MDVNMEIKEEQPFSDDVVSQNEDIAMKTNNDAVLLGDYCNMSIKTEVESETDFLDCSHKERKCLTKHCIKQIQSETVTSSKHCGINMKTEIEEQTLIPGRGSQNEREFLLIKHMKHNGHDVDNQIEIKVEPLWQKAETSSVCTMGRDFPPVKSSRFSMEAVSGNSHIKSPWSSAEITERVPNFSNEKHHPEYESLESDGTEILTVEEYGHSEQSGNCGDGKIYSNLLHPKQKNLINKRNRSLKCNICGKNFKRMSHLKRHEFIHVGERPHVCKICDKSFTQLSNLKRHNLSHEGKKLYQCGTCCKSFTQSSDLKRHNLTHEGKKSHQCEICDKSFTQLAHLKTHSFIHWGKPHQCKSCDKSFTWLSSLNVHNLTHEGKKPHQCKTCAKSFTQFSSLKRHSLIHQSH